MGNSFTTTTATASSSPAGYYASLSDLYAKGGQANIVTYSDLSGTGVEDSAREQAAFAYADKFIDSRLRQCGYSVPVSTQSDDFTILTDVAARLALVWLYESRGINDHATDAYGRMIDKMQVHREVARKHLAELAIPGRLDAAMQMAQPTSPSSTV